MPENSNNSRNNEGFVSRWSRRKKEVLEEELNPQESGDQKNTDVDPEILRQEKLAKLNALTDEDMPDVETLNEESDYSGFMSTNVSEGLRKLALAKLFHGKTYNIRDGLDEYDGDYTKFEKLDPTTVTADMKHMIEVEAKKALAKKEQEEKDRMLAEMDDSDEFDEFADEIEESEVVLEVAENDSIDDFYIDEHINVEGFNTKEEMEKVKQDEDVA